jgi:RNA polymerase sigma-70 factor (ECF subfamily)
MLHLPVVGEDVFDQISYEEVRKAIQQLTPSYRLTFNLFVIEGYTHEEISKQLGISVGASKSNLARSRKQVQKLLLRQQHEIKFKQKDK